MLNFPNNTKLNKQLSKKGIYTRFKLSTAAKDKFDADISKITIVDELSPAAMSVAKGEKVHAIFTLLVSLKRKDFDEKNIVLISKLIEQNMLFILEHEGKAKLAVFRQKLHQTDWLPADDLNIQISGSNLDAIWDNIVMQISGVELAEGNNLDEQLQANEQQQRLQKQINALERKARAEKQPKRKLELVEEMRELKKGIKDETYGNSINNY